jgi:hypothetical protein
MNRNRKGDQKVKPAKKPKDVLLRPTAETAHFDAIHATAQQLLAAYHELIVLRQITADTLATCKARGDA